MTFFSAAARRVKFSAAAAEPGLADIVGGLCKSRRLEQKRFFSFSKIQQKSIKNPSNYE
jgi:hypothetical protein